MPVAASASVDTDSALHAYVRGRLADGEGALMVAVASYRAALASDPDSIEIARRSYVQALESGDMALAMQAAILLDQQGILPRDGTLLRICEALMRKDWTMARQFTDRMVTERNFAFLAPIITSWISAGEKNYVPPIITSKDQFAALVQRYMDEHLALQALSQRDLKTALPAAQRALAARGEDAAGLRLTLAGQIAGQGAKAEALALLPEGDATYADARSDIARGRKRPEYRDPLTPAEGFGRLLSRLAVDIGAGETGAALSVRLARIATFADPDGAEPHIVAAHVLTENGYPEFGAQEARKVKADGWYGALAQGELVDALARAGDTAGAIALARTLAAEEGAEPERYVRLGQLLAGTEDYSGAADAFKAAQARYPDGQLPWALLLFEGSALEQAERWEEARAALEQAAKLAPNEPVVLNYLGYAQIERRQNVDEALALLKRASALKPQDPSITDSLGWAQFVTGNVKAAVPVLERAAAGAPADVTINEHLGDALWAAGRRYEARYAWSAAAAFAEEGEIADRLAAKRREGMKPQYAAP